MSDLETLSVQDQRILQWLSLIRDPHRTRVKIDKQKIQVWCGDVFAAQILWRSRYLVGAEKPIVLEIYVQKRIYSTGIIPVNLSRTTMISTMENAWTYEQSRWAQNNGGLFMSIPGSVFIHSANREQGYPYLAVRPDLTEARLNRPIAELIGQAVHVTNEAIALPKERAIEQAIETGKKQAYAYSYKWNGAIWHFKVEVIPVDDKEILVIVNDADDYSWQRGYWLNLAE